MSGREVDVLVCTTIIETGIDISNVNTLIIEDADKMGLAQLHQIRGRWGSTRRAFAYLTYRRGKVLSEVAAKRLGAIREFRSSARASRSPCGIWRSGAPAICWARSSRAS